MAKKTVGDLGNEMYELLKKYRHLSNAERIGALEMLKFEQLTTTYKAVQEIKDIFTGGK